MTDNQLISRMKAGDTAALGELYTRYRMLVVNYLREQTRDVPAHEIEDLSQETWLRVWAYIGNYVPRGHFKGWLCTIAIRLFIDTKRKKSSLLLSVPDAFFNALVADEPKEETDLSDLINSLSKAQREVAALRVYGGFRYHEIAKILKLNSVNTSTASMLRATKALRKLMKNDILRSNKKHHTGPL